MRSDELERRHWNVGTRTSVLERLHWNDLQGHRMVMTFQLYSRHVYGCGSDVTMSAFLTFAMVLRLCTLVRQSGRRRVAIES